MKRLLYKTTIIALLLTSVAFAQTKTVYKKSFRTSSAEKFEIRATNVPIVFETSPDDQIHIHFSMDFKNYSEKEIKELMDQLDIKASSQEQFTRFEVSSKKKLPKELYILLTKDALVIDYDDLKTQSKKKGLYKPKDSVLREIQKTNYNRFLSMVKIQGEDGVRKDIPKESVQVLKNQFVIKIPKHVFTRVKGMDAEVFLPNDVTQRIDISLSKGLIRAKSISHELIELSFDDMVNVQIENVQVNKLAMKDVTKGLIGSIHQTKCMFKGSRVEIGYVGKDLDIRDFSSKIFLYNFDPKFEKLNLNGEYTELNIFDYGKHVGMKAEGNITLMIQEKDKESELRVAVVEKQTKDPVFGKVTAKMEKGILRIITDK